MAIGGEGFSCGWWMKSNIRMSKKPSRKNFKQPSIQGSGRQPPSPKSWRFSIKLLETELNHTQNKPITRQFEGLDYKKTTKDMIMENLTNPKL
ncbi:hypothetical protein O181_083385 [Austropuccinia psidii MF-1]|uniref:Uncharacterized protein n=1 Tax=Austropuccinia psidii MF-1 TaxID=1389203 RepID=A0A9Q3ILL5_9BASI|nr:hypothetical protein [Austropuccinia psidii MF-1]